MVSWYEMIVNNVGSVRGSNKLWDYVISHATSFEEFIINCTETISDVRGEFEYKKSLVKNQLDYFTDEKGVVCVNFIGKFENLQEDFQQCFDYVRFT